MGRRNKCKTPLTKQENRLKKDGRLSITGVGQSTQYFPAKAGDAHAHDLTAFRGGASRSLTCVESAFVLNRRVDLHAIDATPARG